MKLKTMQSIIISVFLLFSACHKDKAASPHKKYPLGEKGIYLGMTEEEVNKVIGFDLLREESAYRDIDGKLFKVYTYSGNVLSDTRSRLTFNRNKKLVGFSFEVSTDDIPEDKFKLLLNEYEKLYGDKTQYPTGNSFEVAYRWESDKSVLTLSYWSITENFGRITKGYILSDEEKKKLDK